MNIDAEKAGAADMTLEEINEEIAALRPLTNEIVRKMAKFRKVQFCFMQIRSGK